MRKMSVYLILSKSNTTKLFQQNENKKCNVYAKSKIKNNLAFAQILYLKFTNFEYYFVIFFSPFPVWRKKVHILKCIFSGKTLNSGFQAISLSFYPVPHSLFCFQSVGICFAINTDENARKYLATQKLRSTKH